MFVFVTKSTENFKVHKYSCKALYTVVSKLGYIKYDFYLLKVSNWTEFIPL